LPAIPSLDPSTRPSIRSVTVIGHLAAGATIDQARAELAGAALTVNERRSSKTDRAELTILPLRDRYTAATQNYDLIFLSVVLCVVLIAFVNLTNLLLARGLDQRREFVVRAALGATPRRLARHVVTQQAVLAIASAAVGLLFARGFIGFIRSLSLLDSLRPAGMEYRIDAHVIVFAFVVAFTAASLMSIVPVRLVLAADAQDVLRENATTGNERASRLQRAFVAAQVAFAVMLLISAGLAVRTVMYLSRVQLGFDPEHVVQASPSLPHDWRVKEKYLPAIARIEDVLRALPATRSIAMRANNALGSARAPATLTVVGETSPIRASSAPNTVLAVDSGYFNTLRIPLSRGRAFSADDREASTPVAMINEWAASRWFAGRDPIGARLQIDSLPGQSVTVTIVGVVKDNRAGRGGLLLADEGPELYRPFAQSPSAFPTFFVRLDGAIAPVLRPMRAELGQIVLGRPVSTTAISDAIARQLDGARTTARQIFAFSAVGLILALIGVYGVLSYSVKRRTRELGIRRALGATASGVYGLIVRDALVVAVPGVLLGAAGALYTARFVAPLLHGTSAYDAATFVAITVLVLATAVLAAVLPAVRASRVSPLTAIRTS
jgi:predicted permease